MSKKFNGYFLRTRVFLSGSKGVGIKEIAAALAIVVLIGVAFTVVKGQMPAYINWVWDKFTDFVDSTFKT
ncbi:MAG: hypothetical protein N2489_02130 [Clostridia bacterium]|nr:hypothetical protein [Clostridia bacterium]